ncbi:Aminopeptidase [Vibrio aerogenes CECT 7868]|uniref:Aminopeptidase n=1 Tax=Vibrio aerogenes CECT 7868 TaxID=1216006 RepID=A0A1M5ZIN3_9VIBR|nr:aminopeptidase P family protein [Vibrio aerogenes]SHI24072.1 Aminopeptidase [Vibrio aerogenes CECT 7868]
MQEQISARILNLRHWLKENQLDALIIPHENEYLGEYLPAHDERLQWATGFTGSAGVAIITQTNASIFVDGRYTVQVTKQVPDTLFEYHHLTEEPYLDWIKENVPASGNVAYDPKLHSAAWLSHANFNYSVYFQFCALENNPIDQLWHDRPQPEYSPLWLMPAETTGIDSLSKRQQISGDFAASGIDSAILTSPESICWLLNIRGSDISRLPVVLCYAILHADASIDLFIHQQQVIDGFAEHVGDGVRLHSPDSLLDGLNQLKGKQVLLDNNNSNAWFEITLNELGVHLIQKPDPCLLTKAMKNQSEINGMQACHIRDGIAMAKFLSWLDSEVNAGHLHDEATLSDTLQDFRFEDPTLIDLSFDTISAAGSNAAMCHYNHNNQPAPGQLSADSLYLVDSGGQYTDGTTDITRTVAIGQVTPFMKQQFTLVLKGHIALASARFPDGTTGHQLDALARQYLWQYGFDFDHGTGHGVGHCLNVHEGPQRISKAVNHTALQPGMVISNEPGYYREGHFGIRIENLERVVRVHTDGDQDMFGFEPLTRCPIDLRVIDQQLLTDAEITWLNQYHQKVWDDISPLVDGEVFTWLEKATQPIGRDS